MRIEDDPRFIAAIAQCNAGEWLEASEAFEDLFFEGVRDEVEFARVFLQLAVGFHHVERGQQRAAIQRLEECLLAIAKVKDARRYDLAELANDVRRAIGAIARRERIDFPAITRRSSSLPSSTAPEE